MQAVGWRGPSRPNDPSLFPLGYIPAGCEPYLRHVSNLSERMTPLWVTATLATGYVAGDLETGALMLDGMLGFALLQSLPYPVEFSQAHAATIPVPLDLLWVSPDGRPLWACAPLVPVSASAAGREYWHRRYPVHRADLDRTGKAWTAAGRWKDYRTPITVRTPCDLAALVIGHAGEIARLLQYVTHAGKLVKTGYGYVGAWSVEPAAGMTREEARAVILASRAVPVMALGDLGGTVAGRIEPRGWTPPYWYLPWHDPCLVPEPTVPPAPSPTAAEPSELDDIDWVAEIDRLMEGR